MNNCVYMLGMKYKIQKGSGEAVVVHLEMLEKMLSFVNKLWEQTWPVLSFETYLLNSKLIQLPVGFKIT